MLMLGSCNICLLISFLKNSENRMCVASCVPPGARTQTSKKILLLSHIPCSNIVCTSCWHHEASFLTLFKCSHRLYQFCWQSTLEWLIWSKHIVQSHHKCLLGFHSWLHALQHTTQYKRSTKKIDQIRPTNLPKRSARFASRRHICITHNMGCWLVYFHVFQLLPIWLTQQNLCCSGESLRNHQQNQMSSNLVKVIVSACFLIP